MNDLVAKLRYMGKLYQNGNAARGGGSEKHYLTEAADEIERLREIEKAASDLRGYARRIDGDAHTITLTIIADDWEAFKKSLDHLDTQERRE